MHRTVTRRGLLAALFTLPLAASAQAAGLERLFAPSADPWERWLRHDPASTTVVDHALLDMVLERHVSRGVDGIARVDYRALRTGRQPLDAYVARCAGVAVDGLNRNEQAAFWINLYNALTLRCVIDHWPVDSIRDIDISPGLFADGPWDARLIVVAGERLSLNDIEHRILRPLWREPRMHYALNCASLGCPDLRAGAWRGADLERQLDEQARAFVNHPRGARVEDGRLRVSSIYDWFREDFGADDLAVIAHIRAFAAPELRSALDGIDSIAGDFYDWRLNGI
ncbi:MAG: DUF547 domain-containing protein [Pseudomonadota bacterium]|nr:DUF547 domain-containing protein [Pseudomonadota bacterium]